MLSDNKGERLEAVRTHQVVCNLVARKVLNHCLNGLLSVNQQKQIGHKFLNVVHVHKGDEGLGSDVVHDRVAEQVRVHLPLQHISECQISLLHQVRKPVFPVPIDGRSPVQIARK